MNKQQLHEYLVLRLKQGSIVSYYLRVNMPKAYAKIMKQLGEFNTQMLYDFLRPDTPRHCLNCNQPLRFKTFADGYKRYCGVKCSNSDPQVQTKKVEAYRKRYGVDNPSQAKAVKYKKIKTCRRNHGVDHPQLSTKVRAKSIKTMRRKFGVEYALQNADVLKQHQETCMASYGVSNPSQSETIKVRKVQTVRKNYGVDNPSQAIVVKRRKRNTCLANWGVPNNMQSVEGFRRNYLAQVRTKHFVCGPRTFELQGYEPQALQYLVNDVGVSVYGIREVTKSIPYIDFATGKTRHYFPDFRIGNICVEVKSEYTAGLLNGSVSQNLRDKYRGVCDAGYDFLLLVMNNHGGLVACCFNDIEEVHADEERIRSDVLDAFYMV